MKKVNRLMTNICSDHLAESKHFYTALFDFDVNYDSDWFIHLITRDRNLELGIVDRSHEIVPIDFQTNPNGFYTTFVMENVDGIYDIAKGKGFKCVSEPANTFYGQRRLLLKDPDGTWVDLSSPIKDFKF
ncbi:VOC family protein [uncultured Aquimarina sp.]|uniref:VOC family protein n=1 Tax=uncultured Aquimarina sp. TaxID=575652 RepID=UPI0026344267|nr:VOC family protein [uncultured Aquimarina sp.]